MATNHQVKQGDCISSIAFEYGFFPDTIWNHPNNAELKEKRKDPNVLMPGDIVSIPDKRIKEVSESTNQVHKFQCKNTPSKLEVKLLKYTGEPRSNEKYTLEIDGKIVEGETNSDGQIRHSIPPNLRTGTLLLNNGTEKHELLLGNLNPIDEISGQQFRLKNLGYFAGKIDGQMSLDLEGAIVEFQLDNNLTPSGKIDDQTKSALQEYYGE